LIAFKDIVPSKTLLGGGERMETRYVMTMVRNFLHERCKVSCQSKLPTESEVKQIFVGLGARRQQIDEALKDIELFRYGPYISDHQIDVL
jgi:hypothetical protein